MNEDETAYELLERAQHSRPISSGVAPLDLEVPQGFDGDIVEISAPYGCCKTEIGINIAAHVLLPEAQGGLNASVLWLACRASLCFERLVTVLLHHLPESFDQTEVRKILQRLLVGACA